MKFGRCLEGRGKKYLAHIKYIVNVFFFNTQRIHGTGVFAYLWLIFYGKCRYKYTSPIVSDLITPNDPSEYPKKGISPKIP